MEIHAAIPALLCFLHLTTAIPVGTAELKGTGGYVTVRPNAHMFWYHCTSPKQVSSPGKPWPTILWMHGDLGESSVGIGSFLGIGPLDANMKPHNSTWLDNANLLFVDHPVGVGFSYAVDKSALAKTDSQAASDMVELLKLLCLLESSPLFLVGEFYGAKMAAITGVYMARAIKAGSLKLTLGGVVLGNGWISPADFAMSYTSILSSIPRLDSSAVGPVTSHAMMVKEQMEAQQFSAVYKTWSDLLDLINLKSGQCEIL